MLYGGGGGGVWRRRRVVWRRYVTQGCVFTDVSSVNSIDTYAILLKIRSWRPMDYLEVDSDPCGIRLAQFSS